MGIFKRIGSVITANVNDLVDHCEDPEKMLKQTVREMEDATQEALDGAARSITCEKVLARELVNSERESERWSERARESVRAGDDDTAKDALARKVRADGRSHDLQEQLHGAGEISSRLRVQIEAMKEKMREARLATIHLTTRKRAVVARRRLLTTVNHLVVDDPFARFDRLRSKVEEAEAEVSALAELGDTPLRDIDGEWQAKEHEALLDEELAALKKEVDEEKQD